MLEGPRRADQKLFVRISALGIGLSPTDLAVVMPAPLDGVALPKCSGAEDVRLESNYLDAFEVAHETAHGQTQILAIATETAESLFGLGSYNVAGPRLVGINVGG